MASDANENEAEAPKPMSADDIKAAEVLMGLMKKPITDDEAIRLQELLQGPEVPTSDDQLDTISNQDTVSYRGSPTPEPTPPKPLSPPTTLTGSDDSKSRSSQEAASQPLEHDATKRKRGAEDTNITTTAPLAKKPRQRTNKNSAKKPKAAAAKVPMTAEEKKAAREVKAEQERQIYQQKAYKPRVRKELDVKLDPIGVPLPAEGLPSELTVIERKPRASRTGPNQA